MFSGIVQRLGTVKKIKKFGEGKRFYIDIISVKLLKKGR